MPPFTDNSTIIAAAVWYGYRIPYRRYTDKICKWRILL